MKRILTIITVFALAITACSSKPEAPKPEAPMLNPSALKLEHTSMYSDTLILTWKDNSKGESGFSIWDKNGNTPTQIALLDPDVTEYVIVRKLEPGKEYSYGVRAEHVNEKLRSQIIYKSVTIFDYTTMPYGQIVDKSLVYTPTSVSVKYKLVKSSSFDILEYGLIWTKNAQPDIEKDYHTAGPANNAIPLAQTVPNTYIDYETDYNLFVYVRCDAGVRYSEPVKIKLTKEPKAISLDWKKITKYNLPAGLELFETTSTLNGRNFHGWYAIADVQKSDVEFRFKILPNNVKKNIEDQFDDDCYIMTNAGYFNMSTGASADFFCIKGETTLTPWMTTYYGTFAVDKDQHPFTGWTSRTKDATMLFYDQVPGIWNGLCTYEACTPTYPTDAVDFTPYYAFAAGPLLVQNGKCIPSGDLNPEGKYITNYEDRASDIYSPGTSNPPDRTAVGYTADGKIVICICDGRISESRGATIVEMAQIMMGIGCVGACNFDGGGSTTMVVNGTRLNYSGDGKRPVPSTMGFFKK